MRFCNGILSIAAAVAALLLSAVSPACAFVVVTPQGPFTQQQLGLQQRSLICISSSSEDDVEASNNEEEVEMQEEIVMEQPSDVESSDVEIEDEDDSHDEELSSSSDISKTISLLQSLGAITGRGEFASRDQRKQAEEALLTMELANPTSEPSKSELMLGRWDLVYASTSQLFRSSPFFMAGRAVCTTDEERDQYNWFCDMHRKALAISTIAGVRQIVTTENRLVSEFEVQVGSIPFLNDLTPFSYSGGLPVTINGALVSSADITPLDSGEGWEIYMDTVEVKGSNIPGLRQLIDNGPIKLESRQLANVLEQTISSYTTPRPIFRTTYLDDTFRISRDQDDNIFFYVKTSNDTDLTDYSNIDSDLGIGKLLEGFNDAVTKFYL